MSRPPDTGDRGTVHFLSRALDRDPASLAFVGLADLRLREGGADEAIRLCRAGLAHHPNHSTGHLVLALALAKKGEEEEALRELQATIELDPGNRIAARRLAEAERRGRREARRAPLRESEGEGPEEETQPAPDAAEIAFFTFSMAEVYEQQGFFEKALLIYDRVLRLQPERRDVRERIESLKRKLDAA